MKRATFKTAPCSIARSVDVLGDWWNLLIIRECLYGTSRFDELQHWLDISRNMLSRRLTQLIEHGLLERSTYQTRPLRYEYFLTDKGYDSAIVLMAIMPFGERWYFKEGAEPIHLFDQRTGQRVLPELIDANTGQRINPKHLYAGPGPGFPESKQVRAERFIEFYRRERSQRGRDDEE